MSTNAPISFDRLLRALCWVVFAVSLVINLAVWSHPRGADLGEGNPFRQFQTALTTRYLIRDGFKLDYETPVLGPTWSIPMEFPVYQYAVAAVVRLTGMPLEPAGRIVAMAFFWATLPAVWLLLRGWHVARETRLLAMGFLLTCPIYLYYGRHFLIETTALCLGTWFLWSFAQTLRSRSLLWGVFTLALAATAGLAKITTFFTFGIAAALVMAVEIRRRPREWMRLLAWSALIMVPALVVSFLWIQHADALKAQNPFAGFLVSSKLHDFNFARPGQRLDLSVWLKIYDVTHGKLATEISLTLALVGFALAARPRRWLIGGCLVCYLIAVAVFTNLYFVHDYYFAAIAVFLVVAVTLGLESLLLSQQLSVLMRGSMVALVLLAQLLAFWRAFGTDFVSAPPGAPLVAPLVDRLTDPDEVIVVIGQDWNSRLLYFSDRRGLMIPSGYEQNSSALQKSVSLLGSRRIGALIVEGGFRENPQLIVSHARILGLTLQPIVEGDGLQLYLRKDRLGELTHRLAGLDFPAFKVNWGYDPATDPKDVEIEADLTSPTWQDKFPMTSPAPQRMTGIFLLTFADLNGHQVIGTHAPNNLYFQPPAGARQLQAVGGMFPGSYEGAEYTDGVAVEVWESLPDGNQLLHFRRALLPHERAEDRAEFTIDVKLDRPFLGPVYLRVDPGAFGRINYDWVYWRSVKIH